MRAIAVHSHSLCITTLHRIWKTFYEPELPFPLSRQTSQATLLVTHKQTHTLYYDVGQETCDHCHYTHLITYIDQGRMTTIPLVTKCKPDANFAIHSCYGRLEQFSYSNACADMTSYFHEICFFSCIEKLKM
jgi:hypothetical protein